MDHIIKKPAQAVPELHLGIIDFDSPIYRCSAVFEDDEDGLDGAKLQLIQFVQHHIVNQLGCQEYIFVISGMENFRYDIATSKPYKGQRVYDKPLHYLPLKEWAIEHFNCHIVEGIEADDAVIALHQKYQGTSVLVGMDKDNFQSPGWHFNFTTNEGRHVSPEESQYVLAWQMLRGDPGDNIPGLQGVGEAKATKYLEENKHLPPMRAAYNFYKEKGLEKEYYKEQYRLLYMLRDNFDEFERSFIKLQADDEMEAVDEEDAFEGFENEVQL